jgi:hypothetical protein
MPSSSASRTTRRVIEIASLALAGLIAGLLAGCSGSSSHVAVAPNDTGWSTPSTYASAIATMPPRTAIRSARLHLCSGVPCPTPVGAERVLRVPHRVM